MYAVFGNPIDHSLSPKIIEVTLKIKSLKISLDKNIFKKEFISLLINNNITFGNVTYPFKNLIYEFSDYILYPADKLKSINCFVFKNGKIISTNTDGEGFFSSLLFNNKEIYNQILRQRFLIIAGSGATAKSIGFSAKIRGINPIFITRNEKSCLTRYSNSYITKRNNLKNILSITYKNATSLIKKKNPIIISTLPFSCINILNQSLSNIKINNINYKKLLNNKDSERIKIDKDITDFFRTAINLNIPIFDSNYKDYLQLQLNNISIPENIYSGIDQLIGQALHSIYFFNKSNLLNEFEFKDIKKALFDSCYT